MKSFNLLATMRVLAAITLLLLSETNWLYGQGSAYSYFYRVYLRDKGENVTGNYSSKDLLSDRAVNRRQKAGIPVPDFRDIPVYSDYLNQITTLGFKLHCTSKWLNTALFKTRSPADIKSLLDLPFVSDVKIVKTPGKNNSFNDKLDFKI